MCLCLYGRFAAHTQSFHGHCHLSLIGVRIRRTCVRGIMLLTGQSNEYFCTYIHTDCSIFTCLPSPNFLVSRIIIIYFSFIFLVSFFYPRLFVSPVIAQCYLRYLLSTHPVIMLFRSLSPAMINIYFLSPRVICCTLSVMFSFFSGHSCCLFIHLSSLLLCLNVSFVFFFSFFHLCFFYIFIFSS